MGYRLGIYTASITMLSTFGQRIDGAKPEPSFANLYYSGAHGAILVYDISSYYSYMGIPQWLNSIRRHADEVCIWIFLNYYSTYSCYRRFISCLSATSLTWKNTARSQERRHKHMPWRMGWTLWRLRPSMEPGSKLPFEVLWPTFSYSIPTNIQWNDPSIYPLSHQWRDDRPDGY